MFTKLQVILFVNCDFSRIDDDSRKPFDGNPWKLLLCAFEFLSHNQVISTHGSPQMRWTLFDGYLFNYCSVKYQTFHQVSEKTSQQTYLHQKNT